MSTELRYLNQQHLAQLTQLCHNDKDLEAKLFPILFPYGCGSFHRTKRTSYDAFQRGRRRSQQQPQQYQSQNTVAASVSQRITRATAKRASQSQTINDNDHQALVVDNDDDDDDDDVNQSGVHSDDESESESEDDSTPTCSKFTQYTSMRLLCFDDQFRRNQEFMFYLYDRFVRNQLVYRESSLMVDRFVLRTTYSSSSRTLTKLLHQLVSIKHG